MKLSLFSVSFAGLWGQAKLDLVETIALAGQLGFDSVMVMGKRPHLAPLDATAERLHQVKDALARAKVVCGVVAGYTDFSGTGAAEVPYLEMQIGYVEALCRIAQALEARIVRVFSAYEAPGVGIGVVWDRVVSSLKECCDRANDYGVTIAVQNHHDVGVHTDALVELIGDVDRTNCKVGFDAWSPALRGEDLYAAARRIAPMVACTTNADYVRLPRFVYHPHTVNYAAAEPALVRAVPFGTGFIDYAAFFAGLQEGGFDGVANYEICSPIRGGGDRENLTRCAVRYVAWMREHGLAGSGR